MRRIVAIPSLVIALLVPGTSAAWAGEVTAGGQPAPTAGARPDTSASGGTAYDRARHRRRRRARARTPVLAYFALTRRRLWLYGRPARVSFRIRSRTKLTDVRIGVFPRGTRRAAGTMRLGARRAGVVHRVPLTGRENGTLPEGAYDVRISAKDARGRRLRPAAGVSSVSGLSFFHHRFPLAGPFSYGGADARFGASRSGHTHQGQDLSAAEGTPVLAPRGGVVKAVQYQASGAGHYVVVDGAEEASDYVFMHLRAGSVGVREGETVRTGQRIGEVGNTGRSFGAHLHFEVWTGAGWYTGGNPVDPLPLLRSWQAFG